MSKIPVNRMRAPTEEEQALKSAIREQMVRDRCRLLDRQPFVGKLAMHLDPVPVIDSRLTTACTDGTHLYVDAEFYSRLDPEERLGIIGHEVWHCALRHFQRKGDRDKDRFNYAADVEVDLLLHQDGFKIEMLPFDPDWVGKTAEQIYELMSRGLERFQKDDTHLFPEDQSNESGNTPDQQDEQRENGDLPQENDGDSRDDNDNGDSLDTPDGKDSGDDEESPGNGRGTRLRRGLPRVDHGGVIDPDYRPFFSDELEENWKNNLKTAAQQMRKKGGKGGKSGVGIGNLPGNVADLIDADADAATVDWKRVLLDFVSQIFGGERQWLPPSRRHVWKMLYLPSRAKKTSIEIVLAVDTSGSTTLDLPDFLTELRGMVNAFGEYKLTIIQCDSCIHSVKEYSNDDPLPAAGLEFHGFGGTSLIPPFQYVKEKMEAPPTVFIYLTDGGGAAPEKAPDYPVIWCLTQNGCQPAPWGLAVWIDPSKKRNRT